MDTFKPYIYISDFSSELSKLKFLYCFVCLNLKAVRQAVQAAILENIKIVRLSNSASLANLKKCTILLMKQKNYK